MVGVMGLLIFLLLGLPTPALAVLREFHFVNLNKNWAEAQDYCRQKFGGLAAIESADWPIVKEMIANSGQPYAWIGLYDDVNSWRWSLDNTSLYERELGSWFVFNADNAGSQQHCAVLYAGSVSDMNCELSQNSVCYDETSNSYIPVDNAKTWQSTQSFCRQTYTDLASIRNQQELNDIMSVVDPTGLYWVGLSRDGWKWSDQSDDFSFTLWSGGNPHGGTQTCGGLGTGGMFDWYCYHEYPFICSVPQWKVVKVTLKTDGSVNLNDPLVQEAVLKQMEKDLRGQGLHREFSLRWRKQPHGDVFNQTEL